MTDRKAIYVVAAALLLSGCTIDRPLEYNPELRLMFQPDMFMHVSHDEVTHFPADEDFGIAAWMLPEGLSWAEASESAESFLPVSKACSMEVFITDTTLRDTVKDTLWMVSEDTLWPDACSALTFIAFSPYDAACSCDRTDGVTWTVDALEDQTDLLYTAPQADMHKVNDGWVVPLRFEHAMCRMDFRVKHRVEPDERITIRSITVDSMHHKGTFRSLRNPMWTLDASQTPMTFFEGSHEAEPLPQPVGRYMMTVPQTLDTFVTVEYEYTTFAGTSISRKMSTVPLRTRLEPGRSYTYTLSVGIDDVKFLQEIIEKE